MNHLFQTVFDIRRAAPGGLAIAAGEYFAQWRLNPSPRFPNCLRLMASRSRTTAPASNDATQRSATETVDQGKTAKTDSAGKSDATDNARTTGTNGKSKRPTQIELSPKVLNGDTLIEVDGMNVDLRNRYLAAFLAWLIPGAGHYYQGRRSKATLFTLCVLSLWFIGFALGGRHVVYASWQPGDRRWHYFLQAGVGAMALPALVQGDRMRNSTDPRGRTVDSYRPLWNGFMAPPNRPVLEGEADEVAAWYALHGSGYELGSWFTMIAGLLNFLVIYDAFGGPLAVPISGKRRPVKEI